MSEYAELKKLIEQTDRKVDRLLTWAEGDEKLGTPSIKEQIDFNKNQISEVRKRTYQNEDKIKAADRKSGVFGTVAGGGTFGLIELIKSLFQG